MAGNGADLWSRVTHLFPAVSSSQRGRVRWAVPARMLQPHLARRLRHGCQGLLSPLHLLHLRGIGFRSRRRRRTTVAASDIFVDCGCADGFVAVPAQPAAASCAGGHQRDGHWPGRTTVCNRRGHKLPRAYKERETRLNARALTAPRTLPTPASHLCHTTRNASPLLRSVKGVNRAILDRRAKLASELSRRA